ncbi:MAG: glycosyltransferase family 4 protein [Gammaproteobacteria bacterium]|nr:glycosyltransferase family 4 protein [Gammaproteobacteria bacterium]
MRHLVHRFTWQLLPPRFRRALLFKATAALAPRLQPNVPFAAPYVVVGALRTASGLGASARLCYRALKREGLPVYGVDVGSALRQPQDYPFDFDDGRALSGAGTLIMHVNAPLMGLAVLRLGKALLRDKRVVGYWAWELPEVPEDWQYGVEYAHEVWVPSQFTADAVRPLLGARPLRVVPHPVAADVPRPAPPTDDPAQTPFRVLTVFNMGSGFRRKNPIAAVKAFRLAFADDEEARFTIKVSNTDSDQDGLAALREAIGGATNIHIVDSVIAEHELALLYDRTDVLLSLHRAEGFGLTLAEAMLRGKCVVATNWSGNVDFLNRHTGWPIAYRLIAAEDTSHTYHQPSTSWADADVEDAARALREVYLQPERRYAQGKAAQQFAFEHWSSAVYAETVKAVCEASS